MSVIDKLDRVEYLLKHLPGRHPQQRHAPHASVATITPTGRGGPRDGLFRGSNGNVLEEGTFVPKSRVVDSVQFKLLKKDINGELGRNTYELTHAHQDGGSITYKVRHSYVEEAWSGSNHAFDYFATPRARKPSRSWSLDGLVDNMYYGKR